MTSDLAKFAVSFILLMPYFKLNKRLLQAQNGYNFGPFLYSVWHAKNSHLTHNRKGVGYG